MPAQRLDAAFAALSDPTRRQLLERLVRRDGRVGELAEPFDMSRPAISKHLQVLEEAGLISRDRQGRTTVCRVRSEGLGEVLEWIARYRVFWEDRMNGFARYLESRRETADDSR